jgi:hypothetical protein
LPGRVFRGMMGSGAACHARRDARRWGGPDGADGKGNRTAIGGAMITNLLSPEDIASVMSHPLIAAYWPLLFGMPFVFLFLTKGYNWVAIPLAGVILLFQAWHSGMLA